MSQTILSLQGLVKTYDGALAVDNASLDVSRGEFVTFLGPSGSGKTTTLNLIAGFLTADEGRVLLGGKDMTRVPAHRRGIGIVFQDYLLFPHMTVEKNIEFPLRERKVPRATRLTMVGDALELVGLAGMGSRYPAQLSGGQQQRVALARALVFKPEILLLDEPLGALDKKLRESLRLELKRIHQEVGITFVNVTHDQEEALVLSDRIAVFNKGRISQIGTPFDLYEHPSSFFVATFIGESNCLRGIVESIEKDGATLRVGKNRFRGTVNAAIEVGQPAVAIVRPEHVSVTGPTDKARAENSVRGVVRQVVYVGLGRVLHIDVPGLGVVTVREQSGSTTTFDTGDEVLVAWKLAHAILLTEEDPAPAALDTVQREESVS